MTKALRRGWKKKKKRKRYVCGLLITSFKLPVLSCSQLLKITGFKNTIYDVLALDRCSTCVTVLIYETKMVTVNYVFLCAFFLRGGGEKDTTAVDARVSFLFFFLEYNGNKTCFRF